ncbi:hypothetical protein Tco_0467466 [Tanacetum coccineum]
MFPLDESFPLMRAQVIKMTLKATKKMVVENVVKDESHLVTYFMSNDLCALAMLTKSLMWKGWWNVVGPHRLTKWRKVWWKGWWRRFHVRDIEYWWWSVGNTFNIFEREQRRWIGGPLSIGRCNNYAVLQNIPCSVERKIMGQILIDHALSYALTINRETITYTVDIFLKIVGYEGIVDKVSAFFTKNLAQPWETMFKVFNRCLTTRTSGHDQTKINILQIFHAVINRVHVDYAKLMWWDFIHCVQQKKDMTRYPRFTKIIITDLMKKFPSISQRLEENYHSIKDDIPLVSVYTTGNVTVRGILFLGEFLTDDIRATIEYKEYEKVFVRIDVPTIQPQPVESTQGTNRTPRATRTPTLTAEVA